VLKIGTPFLDGHVVETSRGIMSKCNGCGADVEFGLYSCSFCGTLVSESDVASGKQSGSLNVKLAAIEEKLDELLAMPIPTYWHVLVGWLRWYFILGTLGIAAMFWKKPKPKEPFDSTRFAALANKIERDLSIFEAGSRNSLELTQRVHFFRAELTKTTNRIRLGRVLNIALPALLVVLVFMLARLN
jgi:hypothetical protein